MSNETPREAPLSKRTPTERRCRPARAAAVQRPDMAVGEAGREILERVTDGIVALDREWRYIYANSIGAALLGRRPEELIGKHIWTEFPEGVGQPFHLAYERAMAEQVPVVLEDYYAPWGRWFENRIYPGPNGLTIYFHEITDRRRTDEELRKSQESYRTLAEAAPIGIFRTDVTGQTTYVNPRWCEISGLAASAALGNGWLEAVHPEDRQRLARGWSVDATTGRDSSAEYRFLRADGTVVWVSGHAVPELDEQGRIIGWVGTISDVTEHRRARLVESRLQILLNRLDVGVFLVRLDGRVVEANRACLEAFGYAPDTPLEQIDITTHYLDPADRKAMVDALRRTGHLHDYHVRLRRLDGSTFWASFTETLRRSQDGEAVIEGLLENITEQVETESRLRMLAAALEATAQAIVITDREGRITWANRALGVLTGYLPNDIVGQRTSVLKSGRHPEDFYRHLWETILAGEVWRGEIVNRRKDGSEYTEEMVITPVRDGAGAITNFIAIKEDVTERRAMAARLEQQGRLALVGRLAGGLAHDLNNMLVTMLTYPDLLLREEKLSPRSRSALETIVEQGRRSARLLRQMLDFSRPSAGQLRPVSIGPFLDDLAGVLRSTLPETIRVTLHVGDFGGHRVMADPIQLQQILMNLALNARDAMPAGGELSFRAEPYELAAGDPTPCFGLTPGHWVRLTTTDTGSGIRAEDLPRVFEPFFTTKPPGQGTGLGLSQVYGLVKAHGGQVTVGSSRGAGTIVEVWLPATLAEEPPVTCPDLAGGRGETVLVVEDESAVREAVRAALDLLGYRVLESGDGLQALAVLEAGTHVDLLVTDATMPVMGGLDLLHAARQRGLTVPAVVLTGYATDSSREELLRAGATEVVHKPLELGELAAVVRRTLTRR